MVTFRSTRPPKRLNPALFRADGRGMPTLSRLLPTLEELVGNLDKVDRVFVIGSQTNGTFRTAEDVKVLESIRMRNGRAISQEEVEFVAGLFQVSSPWARIALTGRRIDRTADDTLIKKIRKGGVSDLDVLFRYGTGAAVPTTHEFLIQEEELSRRLGLPMTVDFFFPSFQLFPGTVFDLRAREWFRYQ